VRASARVSKNFFSKPWSFPTHQNILEEINETISNSFSIIHLSNVEDNSTSGIMYYF
jgi:hypothetical protein